MSKRRRITVSAVVVGAFVTGSLSMISVAAGAEGGPAPGSAQYVARDIQNMENAFGREFSAGGELTSPAYLEALTPAMFTTWWGQVAASASDPTDPAVTGGNLVPGWNEGNPYRAGWAGTRGQEVPVRFTASDGAVLDGDLFAPLAHARDPYTGEPIRDPMPGVVFVTGSIQASAGVYTWLAEDLAERGYLVLTFDVQGQGRSETTPHQGPDPTLPGCATTTAEGQTTPCTGVPSEQQQDFDQDTEDAITFFLSTPHDPYHDVSTGTTDLDAFNPLWNHFDRSPDRDSATPGRKMRLAIIGHSTGAVTVSYLQGADPHVEAAVALDKITATPGAISDDQAELGSLPGPVVPSVPTLGVQSEYGFEPQPYWEASCSSFEPCPAAPSGSTSVPDLDKPPNPKREEATGFDTWEAHRVDSMVIVPRASTHLDYTDEPPVLPASQWGQAMASYYVQAWLDKYLKHEGSADNALLATTLHYLEPVGQGIWKMITIDRNQDLSFYFCSGYDFHLQDGKVTVDQDIANDGCG